MKLFLHDAEIVAYSVDLEAKTIVFRVNDVWNKQIGEVTFSNVLAHKFEDSWPQNVIFDIENFSWEDAITKYRKETFEVLEIFFYKAEKNFEKIDAIAKENTISGFWIGSSNGMHGTIFAEKMETRVIF